MVWVLSHFQSVKLGREGLAVVEEKTTLSVCGLDVGCVSLCM